ncbi:nuclear pore complex protein Nup85 isoform X2 [Daphnia magna]|uniref:nuclear pore complex protein Nup85 isoform X2 n=1 Tax=Daphnia magna TaxID=35525 RepID=UPI0006E7A72B|nr:nuclear pore complex protein Nup85 isoform X2 [Daphnia magna]
MLEPIGILDNSFIHNKDIGFSWGYGNNLVVFPTEFSKSITMGMPGSRKNLFMISWERTLYNPFVRKLVNESCGAFIAIQARVGKETQISVSELIQSSHQYRCIINACIEDLNQAADLAETNEATQAIQEMSEIFYKAELVWNLCEIMYLENPLGILPHLLEWVRIHFPNALEETGTVLASPTPEFHESFWKALYGLVFQLRIDSAIKLLRIHSGFQTDAFQSAFELLKKMPVFSVNSPVSAPEFTFRWNHWKEECEARIQAGDFFDSQDLQLLMEILCGKEEAFEKVADFFETWYQRMITQLTFTQPTINAASLGDQADPFLAAFTGFDDLSSLDATLLAVLRRDTRKVIGEMQGVLDNSWFTAHLADLLYHAGALQSFEDINSLQLRETLLRDYAICLFSHQSLWSVGVLYLDHCPTVGSATLEHLLTRLPCQSELKASKLIALAERRKLTSVVTSVCRVVGWHALKNGRLGAAVAWAVRAQDAPLATYAADAVLERYLQDSDFTSTDLLDSLGAGLLASDRLAFLGKYREFHRLYSANDFHSAANLLISLISSRIAPKYFWTVLLMDALPLLETNPPVFTSDQTYELMQSLQELTSSFQDDAEPIPHPNCQLNSDKTMLITLALSRNLAKCFVQQTGCD